MSKQRTVLVTGGSRGIGASIAKHFAEQGDRIAVHYSSNGDLAKKVMASLPGSGHMIAQADLRDADAIKVMVDAVAKEFGHIDILINNAGVFFDHPIESSTYEVWQKAWADTLGVNLTGAANVSWCALQHHVMAIPELLMSVLAAHSVANQLVRLMAQARQRLLRLASQLQKLLLLKVLALQPWLLGLLILRWLLSYLMVQQVMTFAIKVHLVASLNLMN